MASLDNNLIRLSNARDNIASAIVAKGSAVGEYDGFEDFPAIINNLKTYSSTDNDKVIKDGILSSQTNYGTVNSNGTYNTTYNNSITVNVSSNNVVYPMTVYSGDSHLINSYELYYTVPSTNKIYIFGKINSGTSSGARFVFSKPLSECGITSTSSLTVYYFSIDYGSYYASSAAAYVKQSYFTITKDSTYVKIEGPNNSQHNWIVISWYPYSL